MRAKDPLRLTLVCWETRNWRHHWLAIEWCKNYKLTPLTNAIYAGNLNSKERNRIESFFASIFMRKTEKYYFFLLHGSIIDQITDKEGEIKKKIWKEFAYEIV